MRRKIHSHRGKFTVLSLSEAGYKQPVGVGLELDDPSDAMTKVDLLCQSPFVLPSFPPYSLQPPSHPSFPSPHFPSPSSLHTFNFSSPFSLHTFCVFQQKALKCTTTRAVRIWIRFRCGMPRDSIPSTFGWSKESWGAGDKVGGGPLPKACSRAV
jgi:hypothetical protein